jgi:hypothetical protein
MGPPALLPTRRKMCCGFLSPYKFKPTTLASSGNHTNHYTTEATWADQTGHAVWEEVLCRLVTRIVGSNPGKDMDVCVCPSVLCCPVRRPYTWNWKNVCVCVCARARPRLYSHRENKGNNEKRKKDTIPASYFGHPGFKSRRGDRLSGLRFSCCYSGPPGQCQSRTPDLVFGFSHHVIAYWRKNCCGSMCASCCT